MGQFLAWLAVQCVGFLISGVLLYSHFELKTFIGGGLLVSSFLSWILLGYLGDLVDKYWDRQEDEKFLFFIFDLQIIFVWNAMIEYCVCIPFLMS